jgi:protein ImuB
VPWGGANTSLLPEDNVKGERLHQLVERLSVRLGEANVMVPQAVADHRPEKMQAWMPARLAPHPNPLPKGAREQDRANRDALYPPWLLPRPLALEVRNDVPYYGGPLRRLTRLYRIETGWWEGGRPALRDYFIARSEEAGLVWIYRERPLQLTQGLEQARNFRWYLQGLYA